MVWGGVVKRGGKEGWWYVEGVVKRGGGQGPSFFTVSRVREIGCFWGNPVKSTVDP